MNNLIPKKKSKPLYENIIEKSEKLSSSFEEKDVDDSEFESEKFLEYESDEFIDDDEGSQDRQDLGDIESVFKSKDAVEMKEK